MLFTAYRLDMLSSSCIGGTPSNPSPRVSPVARFLTF